MSEQGWQKFLAAGGVEDWGVLHGGATAVFRASSLGEAAHLAEEVAHVPGLEDSGALLTITDDHLSVRLTRGVFRLEERHIDLARAVSATARRLGAVAYRAGVHEVQVAIAATPDAVDVGFWRAVLGYEELADDNAIDPLGHGSTVWMQELDGQQTAAARDARRRVCRSRARRGTRGGGPRRQSRVRDRLARRVPPGCSCRSAVAP